MHVTLSVQRGLASLRSGAILPVVRKALAAGKERFGFRLLHFSLQRDHLHLLVEAEGERSLSRGVQGLCVRVARAVNQRLGRAGRLFSDRYHARTLKSPLQVRIALRYVLGNARKHERGAHAVPHGFVDPCSSAAWFRGFARPGELVFGAANERAAWQRESGSPEPPVVPARTWLFRRAVQRAGPLDVDDGPGGIGGSS